jgi:Carboxypeptidase regulatory-like domain/TonB dependent receptor
MRRNPDIHVFRPPNLCAIFVAALFLMSPRSNLWAQAPNGTLRGEVEDTSGARIAGARVTADASGTSLTREVTTNNRGEFRLEGLLPGQYQVAITAKGFTTAVNQVEVVVSQALDLSVRLKPQSSPEAINVPALASSITMEPIDTASAVHGGAVSSRDLMTIPLAARSFANIAYLVPGTEPVEPSDPTKARITAVSTGGSSGLNNELSVDGADNSDDWIGGFFENFSPNGIQEFAFRTANADADTGGTTAGSVVITTKHGTNDWHGDASFYERAAALNARFPIENPAETCTPQGCRHNPKQPFSRQNYVGTLGGPLKKDKLWFFGSFEHVHENASIAYSSSSIAQFDALAQLAAEGLIDVNGETVTSIAVPSNVGIPFRDYIGSLRFDWVQSSKSLWFLRTSLDTYITHNALVEQATLPSTGLTTHNNYWNTVISNSYSFSPDWLGTLVLDASELHLTQTRNSNLGFALEFPFSSTTLTVSGLETYGDNQFQTPITRFPSLRNQEKYQFRYDVNHVLGSHASKFGINFIHEPVLSGAFPGNQETSISFPLNPTDYLGNSSRFLADLAAGSVTTPAGDGGFSQNVQRLALYAQDSWRISSHVTVNYGLRWQTSFGLFTASGASQAANLSFQLLPQLGYPESVPHDYRRQFGPRLGIVYSPGTSEKTVIRAGFGIFHNDLAQNGWATAFQAVRPMSVAPPSLIDPNYKTPYALHATAGLQHAFDGRWTASADYTFEDGQHGYRAYPYLLATVFRSDNRSSYNALMLRAQGNVAQRFSVVAHYTLSKAQTWGCVLGELFDYVNGVCNPNNAFRPKDYGPSGEDVRHRFVLAGTAHFPAGFELTTLTQVESARPFTITTPDGGQRISVNGNPTRLDAFRGTPYIQADLRVSRPIKINERWQLYPFVEFFNLFNRNNPGANFVGNITGLPIPSSEMASGDASHLCTDFPTCNQLVPVTNLKQLEFPAGALGDFFGPGTTVGIPFAAQIGIRLAF